MQAPSETSERGPDATSTVRLRADVFDERCEELGASSETAKAELMDTDRKTLWRYREGLITPKLDLAMRWAKTLDLKVEELWRAA